jgi:hypothetical protein
VTLSCKLSKSVFPFAAAEWQCILGDCYVAELTVGRPPMDYGHGLAPIIRRGSRSSSSTEESLVTKNLTESHNVSMDWNSTQDQCSSLQDVIAHLCFVWGVTCDQRQGKGRGKARRVLSSSILLLSLFDFGDISTRLSKMSGFQKMITKPS